MWQREVEMVLSLELRHFLQQSILKNPTARFTNVNVDWIEHAGGNVFHSGMGHAHEMPEKPIFTIVGFIFSTRTFLFSLKRRRRWGKRLHLRLLQLFFRESKNAKCEFHALQQ